jgi:hypothetical protein
MTIRELTAILATHDPDAVVVFDDDDQSYTVDHVESGFSYDAKRHDITADFGASGPPCVWLVPGE